MSFNDIFDEINDVIDNPVEDRKKEKTQYVAFVIDESGSMQSIKQTAIDSFNEQLQQLKKEDDIDTKVIMTIFNSHPVTNVGEVISLKDVKEINENTYQPDGLTALYEAIGLTITKVLKKYKEDDTDTAVLFIVITDGGENDSKEFDQESIKKMVEDLEKTERWTFTFMGANQNPLETAVGAMSFAAGNVGSFVADNAGVKHMSSEIRLSVSNYYDARRDGYTQSHNFYNDKEETKEEKASLTYVGDDTQTDGTKGGTIS